MKPPFGYYGGKQRLAAKIVELMPKHTVYVEPFAGSCSVLFRKPWPAVTDQSSYREVINDSDSDVVNFFQQLRDNPEELVRVCTLTPYSREEHEVAKVSDVDDPLEKARRFYVSINQSFAKIRHGGWGVALFGSNTPLICINRNNRLFSCAERILGIHIENDDAINVIKRWDSPQTLFYCDPPYPKTCQRYHEGYSEEDFRRLVEALDVCEGSFLLSCYHGDVPNYWEKYEFQAHCSASCKGKVRADRSKKAADIGDRKRTEVVYHVVRGQNVRPEIRKLYQSGKFDCFNP